MMKRTLITTWIVAATLFGVAGVVKAMQPANNSNNAKPFVHISTSPDELDLGTAAGPGFYNVPKALTVNVESNCVHGPITISATKLRRRLGGGEITPDRIFVRTYGTGGFVAMERPVVISQPKAGSHEIVLDVQVLTGFRDMAGGYKGAFTVTVMPPV